jgi:LacI family transcriptional regulator
MSKPSSIGIALRIDHSHPPYPQLLSGIRRYADQRPHWTYAVDPALSTPAGIAALRQGSYDGIVTRTSLWMARQLRATGIPFVNTLFVAAADKCAGVYVDTAACGQMVAEHLWDRGYRRLAYLGPPDERQPEAIGRAFVGAVVEQGGSAEVVHVDDNVSGEDYWPALTRQLEDWLDRLEPPVGVLVGKGWVARFLATLCGARGWRPAEALAIVSMEDVKNVLELSPQITCLRIDYEQVGYEAAALLDRLMDGEPPEGRTVLVPPAGIIARESTDHYAVEDEVTAAALRFVAGHLQEDLSVERVAYEVTVSPRTLQRRFDKALGHGVGEEIRRLRLELAKRLLCDEQMPVAQVAQQAGFGSRVTMNYIFQRELGCSPTAYRRQAMGGDSQNG